MIPWVVLDTAPIPGGTESLRLLQRGTEFSIQLGHNELMNSRLSGSEEALATLTAARVGARRGTRWLIGGYGMGFTLRAALDALAEDARIVLAELVPAVLDWGRGPSRAWRPTRSATPGSRRGWPMSRKQSVSGAASTTPSCSTWTTAPTGSPGAPTTGSTMPPVSRRPARPCAPAGC